MAMPRHDRHQVLLTLFRDALILGNHPHAIRHFRCARAHQIALASDLNQTDAAAFSELFGLGIFDFACTVKNGLNRRAVYSGRQIRMVT